MANVIRLVDKASDSTVLFDFDLASGTGNPNSVKTYIHGDSFDLGHVPSDIIYFNPENAPGGTVARVRHGLTEMRFRFDALATSSTNLFASIGTLGKYLADPKEYTLLLQLEGWGEKRYVDFVSGQIPALLYGQARGMHHTLNLLRDPNGVEVILMRQPALRGPSTTVGPTAVPNDPADTNGRFLEITNAGNTLTPAALKVQGDTGSKVQRITVARKSVGPYASTRVTDYTGGTQYGQLNSGTANGWTGTIPASVDTTTAVADTDASGGTASQTTHAAVPTMAKRIRMTRTANLDSIRGRFKLIARVKNTAAAKHVIQGRHSHSLADPATFSLEEVIHDTTGLSTFAYVDVELGEVYIPQGHTLGGVAFEFWSRRDSGSGNLMWDFFSLVPVDESISTIYVPGGSTEVWTGSQLVTPVANPSGGTAGTVAGSVLALDTTTDNAGTPPNTGVQWVAGRHEASVNISNNQVTKTVVFRVRNITDSANVTSTTISVPSNGRAGATLRWDIGVGTDSATDFYQIQVDDPSAAGLNIESFTHIFVPVIASGEEAHSDPTPGMTMLHKMDSADTIVLPLGVEGPLPLWLAPGLNCIYVQYAEVPVTTGAPGGESKLTRDCMVMVTYSPRYYT